MSNFTEIEKEVLFYLLKQKEPMPTETIAMALLGKYGTEQMIIPSLVSLNEKGATQRIHSVRGSLWQIKQIAQND
jgi:hypothetical protein